MLDLEITLRATCDLSDIKRYTTELFGVAKANHYLDQIEQAIATIRTHPKIGKPVRLDVTYFCFDVEKHRLFYQQKDLVIVLHAVLHQRQLPILQLTGQLE